ncbi:MAG: ROK family protein [Deltaproteobacteria bacterium]|nr:ROK family protein [Deltaproteobacteria bacterium]
MPEVALAVDLGGTAIKAGLVDGQGAFLRQIESATGDDLSVDAVVRNLVAVMHGLKNHADKENLTIVGAGVGVPGGLDRDRRVVTQSPNFPGWYDVPLKEKLEEYLPFPFHLENDANLAALGESWIGAGRGVETLALFTLGTGVGGGLVVEGRVWTGAYGMAGELGHITVNADGPLCGCGNHGCLEAYAQKAAIVRNACALMHRGLAPGIEKRSEGRDDRVTPEMVFEAAREGCEGALEILAGVGRALGIASATLTNALNPEMIVIGGGIGGAYDFIAPSLREELRRRAFRVPAEAVRLRRAELGNKAGMAGAARLVFQKAG